MRGFDVPRPLWPQRLRSPRLRIALAISCAISIASFCAPDLGPSVGDDTVSHASAQALHVPRALDITPLGTFGGQISAVAVDGTRVYVMRGTSLEAYDGRDPANLVFRGRVRVPGADAGGTGVVRVVAGGDRVAVLLTDETSAHLTLLWRLFDVQTGRTPVYAGSYLVDREGSALFHDAAIEAGYLYNLAGTGLRIVDIRNLARPVEVYKDRSVSAMVIRNGRLFVGVTHFVQRVEAYDVSDPAHPVLLAEREIEAQWPRDFEGLLLYRGQLLAFTLADASSTALRMNVLTADPPTLAPIGQLNVAIYPYRMKDLTVFGDHLAVRNTAAHVGGSVSTFDLRSLPTAMPGETGAYPLTGAPGSLAALGDALLVASQEEGLLTLGADPITGALTRSRVIDTLGEPYGIVNDGRTVYSVDTDGEVWVLDAPPAGEIEAVAHASLGLPIGEESNAHRRGSLALTGHRLVASRVGPSRRSGGNLLAIDVADPLRPRPVGAWAPINLSSERGRPCGQCGYGLSAYGPLVIGSRLLVAGYLGVTDINLDDPAQPHVQRIFDPDCHAGDGPPQFVTGCDGRGLTVDASGDRVFVARGVAGVQAFDVAPGGPSDPVETFATGSDAYDVAVTDDAVFVANGMAGLHIADRHSSRSADLSGIFVSHRIALDGDTAFLVGPALQADAQHQWDSVWAVDIADPFAPVLRGHVTLNHGGHDGTPVFDVDAPPHVLILGDRLLATVPGRGIAMYRLTDGRPLPASRLLLPSVVVAR